MKNTLILLLAVLLSSCTKSTDKQCITNSIQLKEEGYTRWNDTRLFGKSFGESSILIVVNDENHITNKEIVLSKKEFEGSFKDYAVAKGYETLTNQADTTSVFLLHKDLKKVYELGYSQNQVSLIQLTDCCYTADIDF